MRTGRWVSLVGLRRRLGRAATLIVLAALAVTFAAQPAAASNLPTPSLSQLADGVAALVYGRAAPPRPRIPVQQSSTAKGRSHKASTADTRPSPGDIARLGKGRAAGRAPGRGKGQLPFDQGPQLKHKISVTPKLGHFNAKTSVLDPDKSTDTSAVYRNADGTYTEKTFIQPVNYQPGGHGGYRPIDTTLVAAPGTGLRAKASPRDTEMAAKGDDPSLLSVGPDGAHRLTFGLVGAAAVAPVAQGSTATYRAVLGQTDLAMTATNIGVKESLILHAATAPTSFTFTLTAKGLTARQSADGLIEFIDERDTVVGYIPAGSMTDSRPARSGGPVTSQAVTYRLVSLPAGGQGLITGIDPGWLRQAGRVFPVTVDPSASFYATGSTYVQQGSSSNHSGESVVKIGAADGTHNAKAFLQFAHFADSGQFKGWAISYASLHLNEVWAGSCDARWFGVYQVTGNWSPGSTTAYPGPPIASHNMGSLTEQEYGACNNPSHTWNAGNSVSVDLSSGVLNGWTGGTIPNYGIALLIASTSETKPGSAKEFSSASSASPSIPYLSFDYTPNQPPQIDRQYPPQGYAATSLTPELLAFGHDPDQYPRTGLPQYLFSVYDSSGNQVVNSGLVNEGRWSVPAGKLAWGQSYNWAVQAYDGQDYSAYQLSPMSTPAPQPPVTSQLSQGGQHGFDPNIGNYTTHATDATVATVGPSLSVERSYNSQDPRTGQAFGAAWSSLYDAKAAEQHDASGALVSVTLTYPDGHQVGFGRNADGSFVVAPGQYAGLAAVPGGGYTLTDSKDAVYTFTQPTGRTGEYALTAVTDAAGRKETLTYSSGQLSAATAVSGRSLRFTWTTPSGASSPHVATVTTGPVAAGGSNTLTWTYGYNGDQLTSVCPPDTSTACTTYTYTGGNLYANAVNDTGPQAYVPFNDPVGSQNAKDYGPTSLGSGFLTSSTGATYGDGGPLAGTSTTAVTLDGKSGAFATGGSEHIASNQTISLWFKTSTAGGVLYSSQIDYFGAQPTTSTNYVPNLYVGTDGKLYGEFWYSGGIAPITSPASVTDGNWHQAVLSAAGNTQSLYLDGALAGTKSGAVAMPWCPNPGSAANPTCPAWNYDIGGGYIGGPWPAQPHPSTTDYTGYSSYFTGSLAQYAFYTHPLTAVQVSALYRAATHQANLLTQVKRPSGNTFASIAYDGDSARVTSVTDEHGASFTPGAPYVTGSTQSLVSSVLATSPQGYWRLGDAAGATQAANQVNGPPGAYSSVTLGAQGIGWGGDNTSALFDGSKSYLSLGKDLGTATHPQTFSLWFSTATTNGVLLSDQVDNPGTATTTGAYTPLLYIDSHGRLRGQFWNNQIAPIVSANPVTDAQWHHALLTQDAATATLYLDGVKQGTTGASKPNWANMSAYVGGGYLGGYWPDQPHYSTTSGTGYMTYFNGRIEEVSYSSRALSAPDVAALYNTGRQLAVTTVPTRNVQVTDPGGKTVSYTYDVFAGNRPTSQTDGDGNTTRYGYDTGGFVATVTDPNGNTVTTGHDVRGNAVSVTTCQDQKNNSCQTAYYTYFPDDTTASPPPDPRNNMLLTVRDGRSSSATDNTYLTSYGYDTSGDLTTITSPPVPGSPNGRTTTVAYTDGKTVAAADSGLAPPGLPATETTPGGAVHKRLYYASGDLASDTDAVGTATTFSYDNLGRVVSQTDPSGTTTFTYDGSGRQLTETSPAVTNAVTGAVHTAKTSNIYDTDGNVTSQTVADLTGGDASRTVSVSYDSLDRPASTTDAGGATTSYTYDSYGNKNSETDAAGNTTTYTFDAEGHPLTTTVPSGDPKNPTPLVTASRAYDPAGRLASITDAMGWSTTYTYFDNGQRYSMIRRQPATASDPAKAYSVSWQYYDAAGNPYYTYDNNGATLTWKQYDAANRVTSTTLDPSGPLKRTTTYTYNLDDRPTTTTLGDGGGSQTLDAAYDPMGRMTSESLHLSGGGIAPSGWWKLTDGSGATAADSSGTGKPAAASGGVALTGDGATLDGTAGTGLATPGPALDTSGSYSVSAWVKEADAATTQGIAAQQGSRASGFSLRNNAGTWSFARTETDSATAAPVQASGGQVTAGTWTHLVATYNRSTGTMTLYVNGAAAATAASGNAFNATGPLLIGQDYGASGRQNPLHGTVENVQAYQRALSATEVAALYSGGRGGNASTPSTLTTSWTLDPRGNPTSQTDPAGNVTTYTYDQLGHKTSIATPAVNVETVNAPAGTTSVTGARLITTTGYDTFGEPTEAINPAGQTTTTAYDADGQPTSVTYPPYTPPGSTQKITPVAQNAYNKLGQLTKKTDPAGNTTSFTYDLLGDVASVTDPAGGTTSYTYDNNGERLSATTPTGARTDATYDYLGHQITSTREVRNGTTITLGFTTTTTYNSNTWLDGTWPASVTSPTNVTTSYKHNATGQVTSTTDGAGNTTGYSYDYAGRPTGTTRADGTQATVTYNSAGWPVATADLDAQGKTLRASSAVYDTTGSKLATTDPLGNTTSYTYDAAGRTTGENQPVAAGRAITTSFGYDAASNRTRFTDGRGNAFLTSYNSWNLPETQIEPWTTTYPNIADRSYTAAYDADARRTQLTEPGGVTRTASYDSRSNLTGETAAGAETATTGHTFGYDADSRLTSTAATSSASDTFTYDDRGLLTSTAGPSGTATFGYNGAGQLTTRNDTAGNTTYSYNDLTGRVTGMTEPGTGATLAYTYNTLNQPSKITYSTGGTSGTSGTAGDVRSYGYDSLHRPISDTLAAPSGGTVTATTYGWNAGDQLTSQNTTTQGAAPQNNTYTYDQAGRLASWNNGTTNTAYTYDPSGNRTTAGTTTANYDARNRLTSDTSATYTYTARGTLSVKTPAIGSPETVTSDGFDRVTADGPSTYSYDGLDRVITAPGSTFTYSGLTNTSLASDGTTTYSHDANGGLAGEKTGTNAVLAFTNLHGDVTAQFTPTGTTPTGTAAYDPYGQPQPTGQPLSGALGYQSGWTDPATGRVDMAARWYSPSTGTFGSRDTVSRPGLPGSVAANRYAYADDNPLTATDPTGHWPDWGGIWNSFTGAVSTAWDWTENAAVGSWNWINDAIHTAWNWAKDAATWAYDKVRDAVSWGYQNAMRESERFVASVIAGAQHLDQVIQEAWAAQDRAFAAAEAAAARFVYHQAVIQAHNIAHAVNSAVHPIMQSVKAAGNFVKDHAAAIGSFVASTAVFIGCEGVITAGTAGTLSVPGAMVCGALAGAVGGAVDYGINAAQTGKFSWGGLGGAVIGGAIAGAVGGALGAVGGKLLSAASRRLSPMLSRLAGRGVADLAEGAGADAAATGGGDAAAGAGGRATGAAADDTTTTAARTAEEADTSATSGGCRGVPHSFTAATPVLMASGASKRIDQIHVGDLVANAAPGSPKQQQHRVDAVIVTTTDREFVHVTFVTRAGPATVTTTSHHPFYDATSHTFVEASHLQTGHRVQTTGGKTLPITEVYAYTSTATTYDLTINGLHTYYVEAGNTPVLVHNCGEQTDARTFYSVQSSEDATRLLHDGGEPWPTGSGPGGSERALLGPGLYTWETRAQAEAYLQGVASYGATGLQVIQHSIPGRVLSGLRSADMTSMTDDAANALLDSSPNHGFQWIRRMTGRYGPENYFSPDVFPFFSNSPG